MTAALQLRVAGMTLDNTLPFADRQTLRRAVEVGPLPELPEWASDDEILAVLREQETSR